MVSANSRDPTVQRPAGAGLSRYDLLLLCIPLGFVLAAVVGRLVGLPATVRLALGSVVGASAIAHGLFRAPPVDPR